MQPVIQNVLMIILPLLGVILPGVLKQDRYTPQTNSLIAGSVVVLASIGTAYSKDQFGPNFFIDTAVVIAGISALLAKPLSGLDEFLQGNVFALIEKQLPMLAPSVASVVTPVAPSTVHPFIHIAATTVHVNTATPVSTPIVESMPEVVPVDDVTVKVAAVAANVAG